MAKALHPYRVIVRPLITEKATILAGEGKYAFEVDRRANKRQVQEAVETAFSVRVMKVNTMNVRGKSRRTGRRYTHTRDWKKAIVTLAEGDTIQIFEGV
ncbi:MAG: 50S ribosomal protein L23 [Chloroflexi bacterium RBG_16_68_14]|nr:MAG: 50S ribosomal protein L23 [Chloroflexi bacterium RBG_16_68_14]